MCDLTGDVDSPADSDWTEDRSKLDTQSHLILLPDRAAGLRHLVTGPAAESVAVVVAAQPEVDVGGGEVGPVLLQHRLVPDGLAGTVQERRGPVVPTGSDLI